MRRRRVTVDFGKVTGVDGKQARGATPTTETWGFRSVCRPEGCVANASRLSWDRMQIPTMVFDQVGDSWVAVGVGSTNCGEPSARCGRYSRCSHVPTAPWPGNPTS